MAMGKSFYKIKQNNKGVSLIEIMVTIAMIVIIAGPLINSFLNAMSVNSNARKIQNGTTVAQDIVEEIEALSLEQLSVKYTDYFEENLTDPSLLEYKSIPVTGPNGEEFEVDIKLDPNVYKAGNADGKVAVNDATIPGMSSLYGSGSLMLYKYYVAFDDKLKDLFSGKITSADLNNIYLNTNRKKVAKTTNIEINCSYNEEMEKYEYDIKMIMGYTYNSDPSTYSEETRIIEDVMFSPDERHCIYLMAPIFDIYSTSNTYGDVSYSTDKINIDYKFNSAPELIKNVYFYLAEQEATNKINSTLQQKINPSNVTIKTNLPSYVSTLSDYDSSVTNVKLYTNVGTIGEDRTQLTYVDKNTGNALYEMTVKVRLQGDEQVIAEFTSSK